MLCFVVVLLYFYCNWFYYNYSCVRERFHAPHKDEARRRRVANGAEEELSADITEEREPLDKQSAAIVIKTEND